MTRTTIMATLALAALLALAGCGDGPTPTPNVLLVVVDTQRADHLGLYGHSRPTSPALEAFAATATVFDRAYSPSAWTRASFASYFTGLHPSAHGCEDRDDALDEGLVTLAERFRARGYATAGFYANPNITPGIGFDQGFDHYARVPVRDGLPAEREKTDAADVNEQAFAWLRDAPADVPWFMMLHYMEPHDPYRPHREHRFGLTRMDWRTDYDEATLAELARDRGRMTTEARRWYLRKLYDGEVAYLDRHLEALFAQLDSLSLADDTVVVVTADHGEGLWRHDDFQGHGYHAYEEALHVPLIVRWPGRTEAGRRVARPVEVMGVFADLVEGLDLPAAPAYQARPLLDPPAAGPPPRAFGEVNLDGRVCQALIEGDWKLIRYPEGPPELYDLAADPEESRSLADDPANAGLVARLTAAADSVLAAGAALRAELSVTPAAAELTEDEKRELKALGYVN